MKHLYLTAVLCATVAFSSVAQIVLKDNYVPTVASSFKFRFTDPSPGDFDLTKSDITSWDLSTLKLSTITADIEYVAPSGTKYSSEFGNANLASGSPGATTGIYQYYASNKSKLEYHGYISSLFTLDTIYTYPRTFKKPMTLLKFPLNHKDTFHSNATYSSVTKRIFGEEGEIDSVFGKLSRITRVDAYGTMVMPDNSIHEVLRLHIEESNYDSVVSDTSYRVSSYTNSWFEYRSAEYAHPLVTVYLNLDEVQSIAILNQSKSTKIVGVAPVLLKQVKLFPNPAKDVIRIENDNIASIEFFNLNAQLITRIQVNGTTEVDISELPFGVFTAVLRDRSGQAFGRTRFVKIKD